MKKTNMFFFKYLGTGGGPAYLFGHVDEDLGSSWERFSKKCFAPIHVLAEIQALSVAKGFVIMFSKSSFYILDIVKDVRFLMFILIPLTDSLPFVIVAIMALILSEMAKIIQMHTLTRESRTMRLGYAVLTPIMSVILHHEEFMLDIKLKKLASNPARDRDIETAFAKARSEKQRTLLTKAELRATENVLEHLPQVIIPFAVLTTLEQATAQLAQTEGKKLFLFLSLSVSVLSIVRGQINLISARRNGQLGIIASLIVAFYILVAIVSRGLIFLMLLHVVTTPDVESHSKYVAVAMLVMIFSLHLSISFWIQTKVFKQKEKRIMQSLWTILAPPLFLEWDELYRREEYRMPMDECWHRTKLVVVLHNCLTCFGNVALLVTCLLIGQKYPLFSYLSDFFNLTDSTSPAIETPGDTPVETPGDFNPTTILAILLTICTVSACAIQAIQLGLTYLYYRKFHPWSRILFPPDLPSKTESTENADQETKCKPSLRHCKSEEDLRSDLDIHHRTTLKRCKSAPDLTAFDSLESMNIPEPHAEVSAAPGNESGSILHRFRWLREIPRLRRVARFDWLGNHRA